MGSKIARFNKHVHSQEPCVRAKKMNMIIKLFKKVPVDN